MATAVAETVYKAVVHREDGVYWAEVPDLPGCFTQADTLDELLDNLQEVVEGYLEADALRRNQPEASTPRIGLLELAA